MADAKKVNSNAPTSEEVLAVKHFTDKTFSFSITRPASFRFRSGEFIMIGLMGEVKGKIKPILRAYSVASPSWDDKLDFYSIKVDDGPLTSKLQHIKAGDKVLLGRKPVGTLVCDAVLPGKRLFMFATGTGIAPFASLIRDPEVYEKYDQVILTHTCRDVAELAYGFEQIEAARKDPLVGEIISNRLLHIASVTQEDYKLKGRITDLLTSGELFNHVPGGAIDPKHDRAMICGSMDMTMDTKAIMENFGLNEGSNAKPGDFVIEKAFVG
ncbi:MAG: ferredoxin--NADP reductase [Robiginitomaculum sp.]|nr:ferredoxin--NADP reductase [Robiginitomaculum sp.]